MQSVINQVLGAFGLQGPLLLLVGAALRLRWHLVGEVLSDPDDIKF